MKTRLVEKMEKWSRKVETLTKVTRGLAVVMLVLLGLHVLSILGIQLLPVAVWKTLETVVSIPWLFLILLKDLLVIVKKQEKSIFNQNKLIYVFLSDKRVVLDILALLCILTTLLPFEIITIACFMVLVGLRSEIAEYFAKKLEG